MDKKVAIIIVNWNGLRFLKDCLESVFSQTYQNFDVYFIDNGSIDESVNFVKKNFVKTKIIELDYNTGFAKGNNIGIKEAFKDEKIEYIVCLNNDTIVEREWLKGLVEKVDYSNKTEMIGSLSFLPNGKVYSIGARFNKNLSDLSIGYGENAKNYINEQEIFSPHGVSVLYTKKLLNDVGLFDEDFFAYCEEFDLGLRARNKGYKAVFNPKSKLIHLVSQSSGGMANPFKAFLNKRNSYYVAIKNFNLIDLILFPIRDIAWNIKNLFNKKNNSSVKKLKQKIGPLKMIFLMIKVYFFVLINLPKFLVKRWRGGSKKNNKIIFKFLISIISSIVILYFLIKIIGNFDIQKMNSLIKIDFVAISFLIYFLIKSINTIRYNLVFKTKDFLKTINILFYCNYILSLIPFRVGEFSYVSLFKKYYGIDYKKSIVNLIILRIFDYLAICFFLIVSFLFIFKNQNISVNNNILLYSTYLSIFIFIFIMVLLLFVKKSNLFFGKIKKYVNFSDFKTKDLLFIALTSFIYWFLRFSLGIYLFYSVGISIGYFEILFISTLMMVLSLIPIQTFASFGIFEGGWVGALVLFGISKDGLLDIVMAVHFLSLLNVLIFGILSWFILHTLVQNKVHHTYLKENILKNF